MWQITLDKATIEEYTEVTAPAPEVEMQGTFSGPEQRNEGQIFIYSGSLVNNGKYTADFVRIVFKIWDENTGLIATDSAFVDGSNIKYANGVITDCALKPGDIGPFSVAVNVPKGVEAVNPFALRKRKAYHIGRIATVTLVSKADFPQS